MSILKAGKAAKSYYDKLKRAQAKRDKEIKEKTPPSARRDMGSSTREQRRKNRTGSSGLKVGTEEALAKGAIGVMGGALGTGLIGAGIATDRAAKERGRKHKEKIRKMTKAARKAESEGKKTFTYEGKEYDVEPRYSSGMIGSGEVRTYYVPVKPKSNKPVKKANGGVMKAKGYSRGGVAKKTPRGVGQAKRGFGRAMNNNG